MLSRDEDTKFDCTQETFEAMSDHIAQLFQAAVERADDLLRRLFSSIAASLEVPVAGHDAIPKVLPKLDVPDLLPPTPAHRCSHLIDAYFSAGLILRGRRLPTWRIQGPRDPNFTLATRRGDVEARVTDDSGAIAIVVGLRKIRIAHAAVREVWERDGGAIELFTRSGGRYFVRPRDLSRDTLAVLAAIRGRGHRVQERVERLVDLWGAGEVSNYELLMYLNCACPVDARSPRLAVLPSVVSDWGSIAQGGGRPRRSEIPQWTATPPADSVRWQSRVKRAGGDRRERTGTDLRRLFESYDTLPAVLYSQFEAVPDDQLLPAFAADSFDFVYKLRKLLSASADVPDWVHRRFGVPLPLRQLPALAARPHRPFLLGTTVAAASAVDSTDFVVLAADGRLFADRTPLECRTERLAVAIRNGFAFYSSQQHSLLFYRVSARPVAIPASLARVVLAADNHFALFLRSPSLLYRLSLDDEAQALFYQLRAPLIAVAVSARFNLAVLLCEDRKARIRCLKNGKKIATFDCGPECAVTAMVTHAFGFVVCVTASRIVLLTSNGSFVKWARYDFGIARQWFAFASADGLDYVGLVRDNGELWYFEAFYPEKIVRVDRWADPVAVLYDSKRRAFKAVLRSSAVVVKSHELVSAPITREP
jgi:hypothetical protein